MIPLHSLLIHFGIYIYAAAAARIRHLLTSQKARRRLNRGAGLTMAGAALSIAVSG